MLVGGVQVGISKTKEGQEFLNKHLTDKVTNTTVVTIKKINHWKYGVDINNSNIKYPLTAYQDIIKLKQKYKLYLNDYDRVIRFEKL